MRRLFYICIVAMLLLTTSACKSFRTLGSKKSAQGSPYELLVVCNNSEWESELGKSLKELFATPVEAINQVEPHFDVLRITANSFNNILPSHRNILKVLCSPEVKECRIFARYDVESAPQIVLTFQGPSVEAMVEYLNKHGKHLLEVLEKAERDRTVASAYKHGAKSLEDKIRQLFGITIHLPQGYLLRSASDNFLWASHEYPVASQGFFLYTTPYAGKQSLTTQALVKSRNIAAQNIPGPVDGSFMTTVTQIPNIDGTHYVPFEPERRELMINGRRWIELRGLWDVENYFMGGPFVSYTTYDEASGKLFTLDCYVYSPKDDKRNFLRSLEHLVYCVEISQR